MLDLNLDLRLEVRSDIGSDYESDLILNLGCSVRASYDYSMIYYTLSATWSALLRHTRDQTQGFLEILETVIGTTRLKYCKVKQNRKVFVCLFSFVEEADFQAVSDIERAVLNILQFVVVDFIGIIISAGLCYKVLCCFHLLL